MQSVRRDMFPSKSLMLFFLLASTVSMAMVMMLHVVNNDALREKNRRGAKSVKLQTINFNQYMYIGNRPHSVTYDKQAPLVKMDPNRKLVTFSTTEKHDKWIVVTTKAPPTDDVTDDVTDGVRYLAQIPGWKVVVVGDTGAPGNVSIPNCVYLSLDDQLQLGFSITPHLPHLPHLPHMPHLPVQEYPRKNIGYMYAVARGARVIYDSDDAVRPLDNLQSFHLSTRSHGLMFSGPHLFNSYAHFGQSTLWPRGFPLGAVGGGQEPHYRASNSWRTPLIQQGLVNGDPDMEVISRLTRKQSLTPVAVQFDPTAPPAFLSAGVFSPFASQNTLFHYDALWALMLPTTITSRMRDIYRSYWAQRLLWEVGGHLGFFPPNAQQMRHAHSKMADTVGDTDMHDMGKLIAFLNEWACPRQATFFACVQTLSKDMADQGFWGVDDVAITALWISDLVAVGYKEPSRTLDYDNMLLRQVEANLSSDVVDDDDDGGDGADASFVQFSTVEQLPPAAHVTQLERRGSLFSHMSEVAAVCPRMDIQHHTSDNITGLHHGGFFDDVVLVVLFNWPVYTNVKYVELMHRNIFKTIVYCGDDRDSFINATRGLGKKLSFIEATVVRGDRGYRCMERAYTMGYNTSGYLLIGDDTLINTWNVQTLDKSKLWKTEPNKTVCSTGTIKQKPGQTKWTWVSDEDSGTKLTSILRDLQLNIEALSDDGDLKPLKSFFSNLKSNTGSEGGCAHGVSDVFYVPHPLASSMAYVMRHFDRHDQVLELAAPMTLAGLAPPTAAHVITGTNLWAGNRGDPWRYFRSKGGDIFLHPIKMSNYTNVQMLCKLYFPTMFKLVYGSGVLKGDGFKHIGLK